MLEEPELGQTRIDEDDGHALNFFHMSELDIKDKTTDLLARINLIKNGRGGRLYCSRYFRTYARLPEKTRRLLTSKLSSRAKIVATS